MSEGEIIFEVIFWLVVVPGALLLGWALHR